MAESKTMLTPLSVSNYTTWKVQCKMALMKEGVWRIVDGTETAPRADDAGYAKFVERTVLTKSTAVTGFSGTPWSGQEVNWKCLTRRCLFSSCTRKQNFAVGHNE